MLVKAFLDESGHSDGPVCAVAGFAGTDDQWAAFDREWLEAIRPRTSLHLKDLRLSAKKPFRHRALLERAGDVPQRMGMIATGTTMFRSDYEEFVQGADWEDALDPYMTCFQYLLAEMLAGLGRNQSLHVFLEEQEKYRGRIGAFYDQVFNIRKHDPRLIGLTFLGKDEAIGFQPADYLAYHLAKDNEDPESFKAVITRPIKGQRGIGKRLRRDDIAGIAHATRLAYRDLEAEEMALHKGSVCGD